MAGKGGPFAIGPDARIFVAGHRGMVGSAVKRRFEADGYEVLARSRDELDLRDAGRVDSFFRKEAPSHVVLAAAKVGGILANSTYPVEFLTENLRIQLNVLESAARYSTERLLFLGSSCIYPKEAQQPISEDSLLTGPLEPTNDAYAIAKIAGITHIQALRRQFGLSFISAMPTNLYGPCDNFNLESAHVLPAIIRRMHSAVSEGRSTLKLWGTGRPRREFLHVDDLADAVLFLLRNYDQPMPINVGTGEDLTIRELASDIATVVGYDGSIEWDTSMPDGTMRKLLDVSRLADLGWAARTSLQEGLAGTYQWFIENVNGAVRT